jgi:hypothetical protein
MRQSDFTPPSSDGHIVLREKHHRNISSSSVRAFWYQSYPKVLASAAGLKTTLDIQEPAVVDQQQLAPGPLLIKDRERIHGSQEAVAELTAGTSAAVRTVLLGVRVWRGRTVLLEVVVVGHACGGF